MTKTKPRRVAIDPEVVSHDWNMLNNQYTFGRPHWLGGRAADAHLSRHLVLAAGAPRRADASASCRRSGTTTSAAPRLAFALTPTISASSSRTPRRCSAALRNFDIHHDSDSCGFSISLGNPIWWRMPECSERSRLDAHSDTKVAPAPVSAMERSRAAHLGFGPTHTMGASVNWLATYDMSYLPTTLWDNGGSVEGALWWGVADTRGSWNLNATAKAAGGVMYRNPGGGITTDEPLRRRGVWHAPSWSRRRRVRWASAARSRVRGYAAGGIQRRSGAVAAAHLRGRRRSVSDHVECHSCARWARRCFATTAGAAGTRRVTAISAATIRRSRAIALPRSMSNSRRPCSAPSGRC